MSKVKVAWRAHEGHMPQQVHNGKAPELTGYQEIRCHLVFYVKMDFTCKAWYVAGGHAPASVPYLSVMSCDSVCLAFLIIALNDVDVLW